MVEYSYDDSVVIIGFGNMGSSWARDFHSQGANIVAIIDPHPVADEFIDKYDAPVYSSLQDTTEDLSDATWCIATPVQNHSEYIEEGIDRGVRNILVEKPTADSPRKVEDIDYSDYNVSIDFIELEHPVVRCILGDISGTGFELGNVIHWRGKISSNIHAYMRDDLVHDVSEIFALYDTLEYDRDDIDVVDVTDVQNWVGTGRFEQSEMREEYDSSGTVFLNGFNEESICMKGGFNQEHQRRYFLWVNEEYNLAYFGSTVTRNHLTPVACKIQGRENVGYAIQRCLSGTLRDDREMSAFISEADGIKLKSGSRRDDGTSRKEYIASQILNGKISPADVEMGIAVDNLIYEIYQNQNTVDPY